MPVTDTYTGVIGLASYRAIDLKMCGRGHFVSNPISDVTGPLHKIIHQGPGTFDVARIVVEFEKGIQGK